MVHVQVLVPFFLIFAFSVVEGRRSGSQHRRHAQAAKRPSNSSRYSLIDLHQGENFFDGFDFFSDPDPTHGSVNYLTESDAFRKGLAYVQEDGTAVIAVDDTTELRVGEYRNSVRIQSKKTYSSGLIIADFWKMPHGCSVWPAWWSVGPKWPAGGEIDILEGVNEQKTNQYTLHTSPGCKLNSDKHSGDILRFKADVGNVKCTSEDGDNAGCILRETDPRSYGREFNMAAGGTYAMLWDSTGIKMWFFSRGEIPEDINAKKPDPSSWGTPNGFFSSDRCDIASHFYEHTLVLDTTLCGDWAGGSFSADGCPGTCAQAVANATNFKFAKWKVNYIAVYDK